MSSIVRLANDPKYGSGSKADQWYGECRTLAKKSLEQYPSRELDFLIAQMICDYRLGHWQDVQSDLMNFSPETLYTGSDVSRKLRSEQLVTIGALEYQPDLLASIAPTFKEQEVWYQKAALCFSQAAILDPDNPLLIRLFPVYYYNKYRSYRVNLSTADLTAKFKDGYFRDFDQETALLLACLDKSLSLKSNTIYTDYEVFDKRDMEFSAYVRAGKLIVTDKYFPEDMQRRTRIPEKLKNHGFTLDKVLTKCNDIRLTSGNAILDPWDLFDLCDVEFETGHPNLSTVQDILGYLSSHKPSQDQFFGSLLEYFEQKLNKDLDG